MLELLRCLLCFCRKPVLMFKSDMCSSHRQSINTQQLECLALVLLAMEVGLMRLREVCQSKPAKHTAAKGECSIRIGNTNFSLHDHQPGKQRYKTPPQPFVLKHVPCHSSSTWLCTSWVFQSCLKICSCVRLPKPSITYTLADLTLSHLPLRRTRSMFPVFWNS